MKTPILAAFLAIALTLTPVPNAEAKTRNNSKGLPPVTSDPIKSSEIVTVNATSITITEGKSKKSYAITPTTTSTLNGESAPISSLKPGMKATVSVNSPGSAAAITALSAKK